MAVWIPVTSVFTSSATVAMATFMTDVSSVIRNWPAASVRSTIGIAGRHPAGPAAPSHHLQRGMRCAPARHQQTNPPSTIRSTPVQKLAASLSRKTAGPTISSGAAMRPSGVSASKRLTCSATSARVFMGVAV